MNPACPDCAGTGALRIPTADPQRFVWMHCARCRSDLLDESGEWRVSPYWFGPASAGPLQNLAPVGEEPIVSPGASHDDDGPRNPN